MSESITSFNVGPGLQNHQNNMPVGYEQLERIEVYQKTDGSEGLRGIVKLGTDSDAKEHSFTLKHEDYEIWGFDPNEYQEYKENPKLWESLNQVKLLADRVDSLEADNQKLRDEITGLRKQIVTPKPSEPTSRANAEPVSNTDTTSSPETPAAAEEPHVEPHQALDAEKNQTEFEQGDRVKVESASKEVTAGWVVLSTEVVKDERGREVIPVQGPNGEFEYVNPGQLREWQKLEITEKQTVVVDEHAEPTVISQTTETTPAGIRTTTVEETSTTSPTVERTFWERRRGGLAVGAAALLGLIGIVYIAHEVEEAEHHQPAVQRTDTLSKNLQALESQDRAYQVKILNSNVYRNRLLDKANKLSVQSLENLKNTQRLTRQKKALEVQIRNGVRRSNHLHEQDLKQGINTAGLEGSDYGGYTTTSSEGSVSYQYPWNWAAKKYGPTQAEKQLKILSQRAAKKGHIIKWHTTSSGKEMLEVDGTTNPQRVLQVITQYK